MRVTCVGPEKLPVLVPWICRKCFYLKVNVFLFKIISTESRIIPFLKLGYDIFLIIN